MRLVQQTGATIYCPDYRRPPEHPFPTPVNDCVDCYEWLLRAKHVAPQNIVMAGDSAGGGMILSVLGAAAAKRLPMPAGGVLWSPWVDLTDSCSGSWTTRQSVDYLPRDLAHQIALSYASNDATRLAQVSPTNVNFAQFPPLQICVGGSECLHDQIMVVIDKLRVAGVDVEAHVDEGMVHVYPLFASFAREESPPVQAFYRFASFMDRVMGGGVDVEKGMTGEGNQAVLGV